MTGNDLYIATVLLALSQKITVGSGGTELTIDIGDEPSVCNNITYGTDGDQGTRIRRTGNEDSETEYTVVLPSVSGLSPLLWFQPNVEDLSASDLAITRKDKTYGDGTTTTEYGFTTLDNVTDNWQFPSEGNPATKTALGLYYPGGQSGRFHHYLVYHHHDG